MLLLLRAVAAAAAAAAMKCFALILVVLALAQCTFGEFKSTALERGKESFFLYFFPTAFSFSTGSPRGPAGSAATVTSAVCAAFSPFLQLYLPLERRFLRVKCGKNVEEV